MTIIGGLEISLVLALIFAASLPLGRYIAAVVEGNVRFLASVERSCSRSPASTLRRR